MSHESDVPRRGIGERHAFSPCIESEQRFGSTEWGRIEHALPTRVTDPTDKAITAANKEELLVLIANK